MATNSVHTVQQPHTLVAMNVDPRQTKNGAPGLLQLPKEILEVIGEYVATSNETKNPSDKFGNAKDKVKAAINAVIFGKICAFTHIVSHKPKMDKIIENGMKSKIVCVEDKYDSWTLHTINVLTGKTINTQRIRVHI